MKIAIIVIGKEKDFSAHEAVAEYSSRIAHYIPIEWTYIPASDASEEGKRITRALETYDTGSHVVALDEKGKEYSSVDFSKFIQTRMNEGLKSLVFLIGGSYGLGDEVRARAKTTIALSQLTFPHQLVRLILAEQMYRACTILKGEKYHH
ncbi:MAG: 23S rRNA (pseudouridine(1915)-N(3))-methyltransferase RlmH [Patescibacteria group bacterium]